MELNPLKRVVTEADKRLTRQGIKREEITVTQVLLKTNDKTIELTSPTCVKISVPGTGYFYQIYYGSEKIV